MLNTIIQAHIMASISKEPEESSKPKTINRICFYELMAVMVIMSYANYYNKVRFLFNLFDFDGDHAIDQDEIAMMVVCILEGWGKVIKQEMPSREHLEKAAKIIYATPDSTADGRITIKVLGDWIDQNENMMAMFMMFEPDNKIEEKNSLFLPFKRDPTHLPILFNKYLGRRLASEIKAEKEKNKNSGLNSLIERMATKKGKQEPGEEEKTNLKVNFEANTNFLNPGGVKQGSKGVRASFAVPISIENMQTQHPKSLKKSRKQLSLPSLQPPGKNQSAISVSNLKAKSIQKRSRKASVGFEENKNAKTFRESAPTLSDVKMMYSKHKNKNIITIKGKTYKRKDIIWLKEYYDLTMMNHAALNPNLMNSTLPSLTSKLKSNKPETEEPVVTFKDTLKKATPGATKSDIEKMLGWIRQEEEIIERGVINYKMPKYLNNRPKGNKVVTFKQIKDYLHTFNDLDKDRDGKLNFEDFQSHYSHILTDKDFESFFTRFGKTKADVIGLDEYLEIMLPQGSEGRPNISNEVKREAHNYVLQLRLQHQILAE